ncbi:MAG: hypothetical protein Hens3KO_22460 [Henriciella sp.]
MAARIVAGAYTSDIATDPLGLEARTETRMQIEQSFRDLTGPEGEERTHWAGRIEQTLSERDFSAARAYLLAAPLMLDRQTSQALQAAAEAEESGTKDQRLARASLLFLPDPVRASYERAIAPPKTAADIESSAPTEPEAPEETPASELAGPEPETAPAIAREPFAPNRPMKLVGTPEDLVYQSRLWIMDEQIDPTQLRLRALALIKAEDAGDEADAYTEPASVLIAAQRSGRLQEKFAQHIASRLAAAMPEETLKTRLQEAFEPVLTTRERSTRVLETYRTIIDEEAIERVYSDLRTVARLIEINGSSGAISLIELAETPDDMKRALLLSESGGVRSVALARELGPDVLGLAQIGVKWTRGLVLQVMALVALGMALFWTALSAFTLNDTIKPLKR